VESLLYVGTATSIKLRSRAIRTIGELAGYSEYHLRNAMGMAGTMIHAFANGEDTSPVSDVLRVVKPKSVGNSITMIHDVYSLEELKPVCYVLCEAVASRMREQGLEGSTIHVSMRSASLDWIGWERKMEQKTDVSEDIFNTAISLASQYNFSLPLRAFGVSVSQMNPSGGARQLSLFRDSRSYERARKADLAMDEIRSRYGFYAVRRACTLLDRPMTEINVKDDHTVHPVGYFQGRKMIV
jgi:DNA polymerase-4